MEMSKDLEGASSRTAPGNNICITIRLEIYFDLNWETNELKNVHYLFENQRTKKKREKKWKRKMYKMHSVENIDYCKEDFTKYQQENIVYDKSGLEKSKESLRKTLIDFNKIEIECKRNK